MKLLEFYYSHVQNGPRFRSLYSDQMNFNSVFFSAALREEVGDDGGDPCGGKGVAKRQQGFDPQHEQLPFASSDSQRAAIGSLLIADHQQHHLWSVITARC